VWRSALVWYSPSMQSVDHGSTYTVCVHDLWRLVLPNTLRHVVILTFDPWPWTLSVSAVTRSNSVAIYEIEQSAGGSYCDYNIIYAHFGSRTHHVGFDLSKWNFRISSVAADAAVTCQILIDPDGTQFSGVTRGVRGRGSERGSGRSEWHHPGAVIP